MQGTAWGTPLLGRAAAAAPQMSMQRTSLIGARLTQLRPASRRSSLIKRLRPAAMGFTAVKADALDASLTDLAAKPGPHFVLFTADPDPTTGKPWCPDCARSQDAIRGAVGATGGSLLEVEVGPRPAWKTPDHPFRHDPRLKLSGIPTLFRFEGATFGARIGPELENANTPSEIKAVLDGFIGSS